MLATFPLPQHGCCAIRRLFFALVLLLACLQLGGCASKVIQPGSADARLLAGKTYVVTGASSGFGRGVAVKLGTLRANVVLAARRTEVLQQVAAEVSAAGGTPLVVTADVSRPEDIQRLDQAAANRFGRIDVWINNAGVGAIGPFEDIPLEDHARVVAVNLNGVIYGSHTALRRFRNQGFGTLVNIGSVESEVPLAYQSTYAATKAAVLSLGRSLNEELRLSDARSITVSTVMPWAADTPFFEHASNYSGGTTRMIALDDPQKVVEAIVWVSLYPREELPVGWEARGAVFAHRFFPDLSERLSADIYHHMQITTSPQTPKTSGSIHQPLPGGTGLDGGVRQRMEREDAERKQER